MNGHLALKYGDRICVILKVRCVGLSGRGHGFCTPWTVRVSRGRSCYAKRSAPDVFPSIDVVRRCWSFRSHRTLKRKMPIDSGRQGRREYVRVPVKNVFQAPKISDRLKIFTINLKDSQLPSDLSLI